VHPGTEGDTPLRRELIRQAFHTSLPQLLRYADRDSMAHSREVRLPLLDRRIAEFAFSCPPEFLLSGGETKRILRDAVRDVVPREILARRDKIGFEPPQARWLSEPALRDHAAEVLLDRETRSAPYLDAASLEADVRAGRWRDPAGLWRALNVALWTRATAARPAAGATI
jgi:asparagine synthase (glutamine-hydrolysing)